MRKDPFVYWILSLLLIGGSALPSQGAESISFPAVGSVSVTGNETKPGYFCNGYNGNYTDFIPFTYDFTFVGTTVRSNLNGCCGDFYGNPGPSITGQLSAGTFYATIKLAVEGVICGVGFGISGNPSCFDVYTEQTPVGWPLDNTLRPSAVNWTINVRRNSDSKPAANWSIKNATGSPTGSPSEEGHYQLCADGMSQATATVVNTSESPTFTITGDSHGCILDPNGTLTAGTNTGTVQITANLTNTDVCLQRDFFFELTDCKKQECKSCAEANFCPKSELHSVDVQFGLGASTVATAPAFLQVKAYEPTVDLGTPALLKCNFLRPDLETITNAAGQLRQIRAREIFVDVITNNASSYSLNVYSTTNFLLKTNGLYYLTNSPYRTATLELVGGDTNHFRVTDSLSSDPSDYYWETNGWALVTGGGIRRETKTVNTVGGLRTEIRTIKNALGTVESESSEIWQTNVFGDRLIQEVFGSGSTARTNTYTYASNGLIEQVIRGDGSWDIYNYDSLGRQVEHYSPFLNSAHTTNASLCRRISSTYTNSVVSGSGDDYRFEPYTPRCVIEYIQGTEVSRRYAVIKSAAERRDILCPNPGASWNDASNLVTITFLQTDSRYLGKPSKIINPDGTVQIFSYVQGPLPGTTSPSYYKTVVLTGAPNGATNDVVRGTKDETWVNLSERVLVRQSTDISSQLLTSRETYTYDTYGHLIRAGYLDGTSETRNYDCCNLISQVGQDGTTNTYSYDSLKRELTTSRDGITMSNVWNAAGQILATYRIGTNGSAIRLSASLFDTAGRLLATTNALDEATVYDQTTDGSGQTIRMTTNPDTSTRIETAARDGSPLKTDGTGVFPVRFTNGVVTVAGFARRYSDEIKLLINGTDSAEWVRSVTDSLGRTIENDFPDGSVNRNTYNSLGQTASQVDADGVTTLFLYDNLGQREYQAVDINTNGVVDLNGTDRITRSVTDVTSNAVYSTTVRRVLTYGYATLNDSTATLLSEQASSIDGRKQWVIANNLTNTSVIELLGGGLQRTTQISPDGTQTIQITQSGRPLSSTTLSPQYSTLSSTVYGYDAHQRRTLVTDGRTGTTSYSLDDLDRVLTVTTPAPAPGGSAQVTSMVYDAAGRAVRTQAPDGLWTTNEFNLNGSLHRTYGARTYPVEYTYDYAGRMETMKTWQDFAGNAGAATTIWKFDGLRGFMTNKLDAMNLGPAYAYTPAGRLLSRTWARGINTSYSYDGAGSLQTMSYSDNTPGVTMSYDRQGRPSRITGATTNDFVFTAQGLLLSETAVNKSWNYASQNQFGYDALQRRSALTNLSLGIAHNYGYDTASRLQSVSTLDSGALTMASYSYLSNSPLVSSVAMAQGGVTRLTTSYSYDNLNRLTQVQNSAGASTVASFNYGYSAANQRIGVTNADSSRWAYGYDALGQVTNGWRYWGDGSRVMGQTFNYLFDDIGNRKSTQTGGDDTGANLRQADYSANVLNQYTNRTVPGLVEVNGSATNTATVQVNGALASRQADYFRQEVSVDNTNAAIVQWLTSVATNVSGTTVVARVSYVPQTPESFAYDLDGNLTSDGLWNYTWDAENRLVRIETRTNAITDSAYWQRIDCDYDYQSRRIRKRVFEWNPSNSSYHLTTSLRFFYDGWNLIGQVDEVTGIRLSFLWGTDLSGTMQGAGGVGGLKAMIVHNGSLAGTYLYSYEGNGNVTALVNAADGSEDARYEYGPFGEPVRATGLLAKLNSFRFSTKYQDDQTDLLYYGCRYYNTSIGRWLSKDPTEERGGPNLVGFVGNNPVQFYDSFGLRPIPFAFDAFINAKRLGLWLYDPHDSSRQFQADDRDFGQFDASKRNARIFSYGTIESKNIGHAENGGASGQSDTGDSNERVRRIPNASDLIAGAYGVDTAWDYYLRRPKLDVQQFKVKDINPCTTEVSIQASAIHPYGPFGIEWLKFVVPSIDYNLKFTFEARGKNQVAVTLTGTHNRFPDYEAYADGTQFFQFTSPSPGPGFGNLSFWTSIRDGTRFVITDVEIPASCNCADGSKTP